MAICYFVVDGQSNCSCWFKYLSSNLSLGLRRPKFPKLLTLKKFGGRCFALSSVHTEWIVIDESLVQAGTSFWYLELVDRGPSGLSLSVALKSWSKIKIYSKLNVDSSNVIFRGNYLKMFCFKVKYRCVVFLYSEQPVLCNMFQNWQCDQFWSKLYHICKDHSHLRTMTWTSCVIRNGLRGYQCYSLHLVTKTKMYCHDGQWNPFLSRKKVVAKRKQSSHPYIMIVFHCSWVWKVLWRWSMSKRWHMHSTRVPICFLVEIWIKILDNYLNWIVNVGKRFPFPHSNATEVDFNKHVKHYF